MSSFKHDCNACIFIGTFLDKEVDKFVDYWYHKNDNWVTLIRRFSDEPSDYGAWLLMDYSYNQLPESHKQIYDAYMNWVVHNKDGITFMNKIPENIPRVISATIPRVIHVNDYHEFELIEEHLSFLNEQIKVEEIGYDIDKCQYVGVVYLYNSSYPHEMVNKTKQYLASLEDNVLTS